MSDKLTRAGLPLVTGVKIAGLLNRALRGHFGSELGPLQFGWIGRVTRAITDKEERIAVATPGMEGAEGHRHGDADVCVQDTEILQLWTAHTHTHTHTFHLAFTHKNLLKCVQFDLIKQLTFFINCNSWIKCNSKWNVKNDVMVRHEEHRKHN